MRSKDQQKKPLDFSSLIPRNRPAWNPPQPATHAAIASALTSSSLICSRSTSRLINTHLTFRPHRYISKLRLRRIARDASTHFGTKAILYSLDQADFLGQHLLDRYGQGVPSKGHCAQQHTLDSNTSGLNGNQQKHVTLGAGALTWQAEARNANRALSSSQRIREKSFKLSNAAPLLKAIPLSLQHLFAMFGASILIPFLFNQAAGTTVVDPALVLIMNGIGTLIYTFVCRGKAPAFLGPSFAFIAPTISCISLAKTPALGFQHALGGFVVAGFVFSTIIIRFAGREWLNVALPPAAMGPIVALIGLELAPVATDMAFHKGRPSAAWPPSSAWPRAYSEAVSKALYAGLRAGELSVASNLG